MLRELMKLADHLDKRGMQKEADYLDACIRKMAQQKQVPYTGVGLDKYLQEATKVVGNFDVGTLKQLDAFKMQSDRVDVNALEAWAIKHAPFIAGEVGKDPAGVVELLYTAKSTSQKGGIPTRYQAHMTTHNPKDYHKPE